MCWNSLLHGTWNHVLAAVLRASSWSILLCCYSILSTVTALALCRVSKFPRHVLSTDLYLQLGWFLENPWMQQTSGVLLGWIQRLDYKHDTIQPQLETMHCWHHWSSLDARWHYNLRRDQSIVLTTTPTCQSTTVNWQAAQGYNFTEAKNIGSKQVSFPEQHRRPGWSKRENSNVHQTYEKILWRRVEKSDSFLHASSSATGHCANYRDTWQVLDWIWSFSKSMESDLQKAKRNANYTLIGPDWDERWSIHINWTIQGRRRKNLCWV